MLIFWRSQLIKLQTVKILSHYSEKCVLGMPTFVLLCCVHCQPKAFHPPTVLRQDGLQLNLTWAFFHCSQLDSQDLRNHTFHHHLSSLLRSEFSLCTASFTILIIIQVRAAAKHTLPLLPLLPSFSSFPSVSEQNGGPKKALKPPIRGTEGV